MEKNVFIGKNPDTGRPYFRKQRVIKVNPNQPPEIPVDTTLLTEEEHKKQMLEKAERDFEKAGHPTKGSEPSSDFDPETP